MQFTPKQVQRYARHIVLPQIGGKGQRALAKAKVAVIGAGGLGCPASIYLAGAGVGTIGIIDFDQVELSNLQRQIIYQEKDIGQSKAITAANRLSSYNSDIEIRPHNVRIDSNNATELLSQYDLVLNGADNFATRYLVNDAAYMLKLPLMDGAVLAFEGQASTYLPGKGCYRCLFPVPPTGEAPLNCADVGVIGALPGLVGSVQAMEAIKWIVGMEGTLVSRLLVVDAIRMEFRQIELRRDAQCKLCGDNPTVTSLIDYEEFCATGRMPSR